MVEVTNPRRGRNHGDSSEGHRDDAPPEHDLGRVVRDVVLKVSHDGEDEPCDARRRTAGVNAANVLQERSPRDPEPERRPLLCGARSP